MTSFCNVFAVHILVSVWVYCMPMSAMCSLTQKPEEAFSFSALYFIPNSLGMDLSLNLELTIFWLADWPTNASSLLVYAPTGFDSSFVWSHLALHVGGVGVGIRIHASKHSYPWIIYLSNPYGHFKTEVFYELISLICLNYSFK